MEKKRLKFKNYLQYHFDNLMTGGIFPIVIILSLFALCVTLFFTLLVVLFYAHQDTPPESVEKINDSFQESFWQTLMHVIDQGTITGEFGWTYRILMLIPTFLGILLVATFVGLITTRINSTLISLRKGRSVVIEENHVVILGWSNKIFSILNELIKANINQKRACIAILAPKDKIEMEDEINEKVDKSRRVKIICRTGNPIDLDDLDIVNPHEAKSVIIISPDESNYDTQNIKGILAILNHPNRKQDPYHLVAEIKTDKNKEIANIVGGDELTLIVSNDVIARIAVQTCLQSGLTAVYNQLLDFSNEEIYIQKIQSLQEQTFKDALFAFEQVAVMGIQRANGIILLNPKENTKIKEGDRIIYIAEDDYALPPVTPQTELVQAQCIRPNDEAQERKTKKVLILGWNTQGATIVRELDNYVVPGSELLIMADEVSSIKQEIFSLPDLDNLTINLLQGDITDRRVLNEINLPEFHNVMVLSYSQKMALQDADANTLVTLIHLRDIKRQRNANFTIVSEMLDIKNRTLAEVAKPDDFIISDHIISLIISQVAENKELKLVYDELFDSHGCEIYLKPVTGYLQDFENVNFYTVIQAALQHKETAIGYRVYADGSNPQKGYGIILNPKKSDYITFSPDDKVVVLAEEY
jgi:ion channel POLLUX/CASTOR